ncbi:hypothetical protein FK531_00175 [Rhodococcus spelaei]|uniref:DUF11 domain-containing protein n=1 Tax=Rhodococcus spelaei TaxID=2546320 RepID=A0A541BQG9_9NOCA|nr:hypothetical protein [Rhodococcus spelaei]TQF74572.1 hypothetical protein FK531_00175 [Rhodococcus spelaei]
MSRTTMRRAASVAAATALLAGSFATGAATASAASILSDLGSTASAPDVPASATVTVDNLVVTKAIVGSNQIAATGQVTYRTTISATSGPDRLITKIVDLNPVALVYVEGSAKVTSWQNGAMTSESVTATASANAGVAVSNAAGWVVSAIGNKTVTFDVTYSVKSVGVSTGIFDSGLAIDVAGLPEQQWPAMGVKFNLVGSVTPSFGSS